MTSTIPYIGNPQNSKSFRHLIASFLCIVSKGQFQELQMFRLEENLGLLIYISHFPKHKDPATRRKFSQLTKRMNTLAKLEKKKKQPSLLSRDSMPGSQTLKIPGHFATILMSSQLGAARMPLIYKKEWPGKILPSYLYISLSREAEAQPSSVLSLALLKLCYCEAKCL